MTGPAGRPGTARAAVVRLAGRVGWSLSARLVSAGLQLCVVILMARGLSSHDFALFASVNVVLTAVVALNGFGLLRQMQLRRARDRDDPELPRLFSVWLSLILGSALLWLAASLAVGAVDPRCWLLAPLALWLWFEQVTSVWNALSLADGRPRDLMPSYLWRRLPVVLALAVATATDLDLLLVWSLASAAGAASAYVTGRRRQETWARRMRPSGGLGALRGSVDLAYWWSAVGVEVRDLDVAAISAVSSGTGALYALPARLIKPMNLVTVATISVVFPVLARRSRVDRAHLVLGSLAGTLPVAGVAGVVALAAGRLGDLVGEEYVDAAPVLRVLCIAAVVTGFGGLILTYLQTRSPAANSFAGRAVLVFGLLQVPVAASLSVAGGAVGAAWGAVGCQVTLVGLLTWRALVECGRPGESAPAALVDPG